MNFFVIGLPRSRTAWLANFLTYDNHFCFHEGLDNCATVEEYKQKLGQNKGDSSTGLMLLDMNNEFPDAPKVIIENDMSKAIDYSYKTYGYYDPAYIQGLNTKLLAIDGLHINYHEIDQSLKQIWDYLIGTPFNHERAELLKRLKIEIKDPYNFNTESMKQLWTSLVATSQ